MIIYGIIKALSMLSVLFRFLYIKYMLLPPLIHSINSIPKLVATRNNSSRFIKGLAYISQLNRLAKELLCFIPDECSHNYFVGPKKNTWAKYAACEKFRWLMDKILRILQC